MFFHGNPVALAPGMVFFLHMILMDSEAGVAMTLGRTSLITDRGSEVLSTGTLDLVTR
jgi:Xaa-Pro dipeptidase